MSESTTPKGLNDRGQVAAESYPTGAGRLQPFLWRAGGVRQLPGLGGSAAWISSYDQVLGARGEVAGSATLPGSAEYHAVLWVDGRATDLGALRPGGSTTATSLNDRREVTGSGQAPDGRTHAFLWRSGVLHDLGVPSGYTDSLGLLVTAPGAVLGTATRADGTQHAHVWTVA